MSTKTVADKLLIRPDTTVWLSQSSRRDVIAPLPAGVRQVDQPREAATAVVFADDAATVREVFATHKDDLTAPNAVWVPYPKGNRTDVNRDTLWPILGDYGMRPVTQVAIDDVWSALRFRPLKPGEPPFTGGR
jgi:hypothetical protein